MADPSSSAHTASDSQGIAHFVGICQPVEGSEAAQAAFVRLLLRSADRQKARFVVWFFLQDVDEFWRMQTNAAAKWFVKIWRDSGLVDGSGREWEGLKEWDRWLRQPRTSVRH